MTVEFYSANYAVARQRFCESAVQLGWHHTSYPIEAPGPLGERLSIDVAISTQQACTHALVVSSGLHGVEGFFGSAVQCAALTTMADQLAVRGMRIIFVHALNPFGFAWSRRVNEDNIDLNRNFAVGDDAYAGSPIGYAKLDALLNPSSPPQWWNHVPLSALPILLREGMPALKQAVAGGQYEFSKGLFFGGRDRSLTVKILEQHLAEWIDDCARVLHLDLHTGLGRWATYRLIADERLSRAWSARLHGCFGEHRIGQPVSSDYEIHGGFGTWAGRRFIDREYLLLYAEFGTYHPLRIILGLRAENQAHHWGHPNKPSTVHAKRRLRRLFCPASREWRARSLAEGLDLIKSSLHILSAR